MGKITTYLLIMTGITLLFYFGGLLTECSGDDFCEGTTPNSIILTNLLSLDISTTQLYLVIIAAIGAMALVTVGLGIISRSPEWVALAPAAIFLITFGLDFFKVFSVVYAENQAIALLISPMFVIWLLGIFEWFRGLST